jgi:hypothetical protein
MRRGNIMGTNSQPRQMNALNQSDLSILALKAAIQLDALQRNATRSSTENYLELLVNRLKENLDDQLNEQRVSRLAPPEVEVWSKAVEAYSGRQTASYHELADEIKEILHALQNRQTFQRNGRNVKKLLEFCTALHSALLQQKSFVEQSRRPKNPRRY